MFGYSADNICDSRWVNGTYNFCRNVQHADDMEGRNPSMEDLPKKLPQGEYYFQDKLTWQVQHWKFTLSVRDLTSMLLRECMTFKSCSICQSIWKSHSCGMLMLNLPRGCMDFSWSSPLKSLIWKGRLLCKFQFCKFKHLQQYSINNLGENQKKK